MTPDLTSCVLHLGGGLALAVAGLSLATGLVRVLRRALTGSRDIAPSVVRTRA